MIQPRFKDAPHFRNFWENGNGKQLIEFSGAEVSFKDFEKYAPFFYHVDETGDEVIKEVYFTKNFMKHQGKLKAISEMGFLKMITFLKV
jgi:hypothetical protein